MGDSVVYLLADHHHKAHEACSEVRVRLVVAPFAVLVAALAVIALEPSQSYCRSLAGLHRLNLQRAEDFCDGLKCLEHSVF
jgi:hypothetical protein